MARQHHVTAVQHACIPGPRVAGLEEALKRKDAIIRVRNAQISALWDELHTRQPWTNALAGDAPINLARLETANASRKLLVIGINTVRALLQPLPPAPARQRCAPAARLETANRRASCSSSASTPCAHPQPCSPRVWCRTSFPAESTCAARVKGPTRVKRTAGAALGPWLLRCARMAEHGRWARA